MKIVWKFSVLDNFCVVKICLFIDNQMCVFAFWKSCSILELTCFFSLCGFPGADLASLRTLFNGRAKG